MLPGKLRKVAVVVAVVAVSGLCLTGCRGKWGGGANSTGDVSSDFLKNESSAVGGAETIQTPPVAALSAVPAEEKKAAPLSEKKVELPPVSLSFGMILAEIKDQTALEITPHGKMPEKASVPVEGLNVEAALDRICDACDLKWTRNEDGTGYDLWDRATYREIYQMARVQQKIFTPRHTSPEFFVQAVTRSNLLTRDVGTILADTRTGQVFVSDLPGVLARVQALFDLLDAAQMTRVFTIQHADTEKVARQLEEYKSESGTIETDGKLHRIVVKDGLANIQRMEQAVATLDKQPPRKVYSLGGPNKNRDEIARIEKQLQAIASKGAIYLIDEERGLLMIEDSEAVHRKVEELLQSPPLAPETVPGSDKKPS
jgi:type II secretory pathway component GspD/PulD (secretin)